MSKNIRGKQERTFTLERGESPDTFSASLSSELPVERWFGSEVLRHAPGAINMERASNGLSLLFNHDPNEPIGRATDIRLDGGKLRGTFQFSPHSDMGKRMAAEVRDGFLRDVSISYSIDEYDTTTDKSGHDTVTVTRWTPLEASIVTVPADHTVGVGRSHEEVTKVTTETTANGGNDDGGSVNVVPMKEAQKRALAREREAARKSEKQRLADINELFAASRYQGQAYDDLRERCIDEDSTLEQARAALLDLINSDPQSAVEPVATRKQADESARAKPKDVFVQAGRTEGEKLAEGLQKAIEIRAGMAKPEEAAKEQGQNEFIGMSLVDMVRAWGIKNGIRVNMNPYQMIGHVLYEGRRGVIGLGTSDFTGVLANVASKSLLAGWEENPSTYRQWVRIGSVNDFRRANRTALSGMDTLDVVPEGGEYTYGDAADRTEYMQAIKYGKLFSISREAILADDLGSFTTVPRKMGRAADLTVNKKVYDVLCANSGVGPTLNQDSTALFRTTGNANYTASSGGPSVANIEVGRNLMAQQKDPNNSLPLNIQPKYLLVPSALVTTAKVLVASEKDPLGTASATGGATTPNPFYNALTVIGEPYLDDSSHTNGTVAWYLIADQNMFDTFEVAFVGGQSTPYLESREGWSVDGVEYKVRIEAGVAALDYRAMYRKKGA